MESHSSGALIPPEVFRGGQCDLTGFLGCLWQQAKASLLVPFLKIMVFLCLTMLILLFVERVYMGIVAVLIKIFRWKPEKKYKWKPMKEALQMGNSAFPMVLVQIPMCNEKEALKEQECRRWASRGINIKYEIREKRNGYKAGALRDGMKCSYVKLCDYVVIFDADFQPDSDFLHRTIPFLVHNPEIALVQTRWKFVNSDESLMTRMQEMSLNYHFIVEQEVGSYIYAFFGFNGTAGVWRISALNEAGGWKDRTTVEDLDLAIRAGLKGLKFLYVGEVEVKSELPSTFKAYQHQQHRWSCGPANLFRKVALEIVRCKKVSPWRKLYLIYSFFFVQKIVIHIVMFIFYCVVLPATAMIPEVQVPIWGAVCIPVITLLNALGTPRSFHLVIFWILFENVMSLHRTKGTFIGLLEVGRVNEWIVTEKLGRVLQTKSGSKVPKKPRFRMGNRLQVLELFVGFYLFFCGCYDVAFGKSGLFIYLFLQSTAFFVVGFGHVGTFVPTSS